MVTGSLGYIGSVLTNYLIERGYDCVGHDTGFFEDAVLYPPPATRTVKRDARDIADADLDGVDAVVHLAGISNDPLGKLDARAVYDPTREYSASIAARCKRLGVQFIFASSCSVYGLGGDQLLDEAAPTSPQTPYSLNKLQIETDLREMSGRSFSPIALRFATIFGSSPRLRFDVVVNMLTGMAVADGMIVLNSDGASWRPNLHILDACEAVRRAVDLDYDGGELLVLNVGDEANNVRIIDVARLVQQALGGCELRFLSQNPELDREGLIQDRKVKGTDTRTYTVSFDRIRRVLPGFACAWTLDRGIGEMATRLRALPLTRELFKSRGFYRLQQLEQLHGAGLLDDSLRWLPAPSHQ
jgi:nucleoside-diphosphate-sugar epimerase